MCSNSTCLLALRCVEIFNILKVSTCGTPMECGDFEYFQSSFVCGLFCVWRLCFCCVGETFDFYTLYIGLAKIKDNFGKTMRLQRMRKQSFFRQHNNALSYVKKKPIFWHPCEHRGKMRRIFRARTSAGTFRPAPAPPLNPWRK